MVKSFRPDLLIAPSLIEQDIAEAKTLRDRWIRHLENVKQSGHGYLNIGDNLQDLDETAARIQNIIDHHATTIAVLQSFHSQWTFQA